METALPGHERGACGRVLTVTGVLGLFGATIPRIFGRMATQTPEGVAVESGCKTISYAELNSVQIISHAFSTRTCG